MPQARVKTASSAKATPPNTKAAAPAAVPKRRDRSRKETDTLDEEPEPPRKRGRKAAPSLPEPAFNKPRKGPGRKSKRVESPTVHASAQVMAEVTDNNEGSTDTIKPAGEPPAVRGRSYWLLKAEQEDRFEKAASGKEINTKFTIDDLRDKNGPEPWDGVRNLVARNHMRAMKRGDWAFFYASGGKQGRQPGITGVMQIVNEAEPDWTVSDPDAYGYVENGSQRLQADGQPRWSLVHVEYRKKLSKPVTLKNLQAHKGSGAALEKMAVLNTARLSVTPVTASEWDFIIRDLVEGYEHETSPGFNEA